MNNYSAFSIFRHAFTGNKGWKTLQVGRIRYGIMLREDGIVMDDGATARLGQFDYFMTTTTANAAKVLSFAEHLLQTAWKILTVIVTSIIDQWAAIAIAGPKSRDLLQAATQEADLVREALMARLAGIDFSLAAFPVGKFVQTGIRHMGVLIKRDRLDAFELIVPYTWAANIRDYLCTCALSFGYRVEGDQT